MGVIEIMGGDESEDGPPLHLEEVDEEAESANTELPLPAAFLEFLKTNGIDPSLYSAAAAKNLPRYLRLKPGVESEIPEIENEIGFKLKPIPWLSGFFSIPQQAKIASSEAYQEGKIYGMDVASGAAVLALDVSPGEHVLDLCAAPGAKLCMLAELLRRSGTLTGVDIAEHRLAACRTMLQKYGLEDYCRLFVADGTSFCLLPQRKPTGLLGSNEHQINGKYLHSTQATVITGSDAANLQAISCGEFGSPQDKSIDIYQEWTSKRTRRERRDSRKEKSLKNSNKSLELKEPQLIFYGKCSGIVGVGRSVVFQAGDGIKALRAGYDKVLVDAECTHDGSIKHVCKFEQWGWDTLERRLLDVERVTSITRLQLQLLNNGFRLLKTGGILVYSTCSLTTAQNEGVVEQFLAVTPNAELQQIKAAKDWPCKSGSIQYTLRFDPVVSKTSGLFIAKIAKVTP